MMNDAEKVIGIFGKHQIWGGKRNNDMSMKEVGDGRLINSLLFREGGGVD